MFHCNFSKYFRYKHRNKQQNKMIKKINIGKISREQILTQERKIRREIDIENNLNVSHNRVHESKKSYKRNDKHKGRDF